MKKTLLILTAMMALTLQAAAMNYEEARSEALFLTDKMAYELNLTDAQYEAAYEINLDYLMGLTGESDALGICWEHRNYDMRCVLADWQWELFRVAAYFFRPVCWEGGRWHFGIYARYPQHDHYYFGRPHFYTAYRGAHSWHMNGGHSYYEHCHVAYRPRVERTAHVGMRNGWNRAETRPSARHSSTLVTGRGSVRAMARSKEEVRHSAVPLKGEARVNKDSRREVPMRGQR